MWSKITLFFFLLIPIFSIAQDCNLTFQGVVVDADTEEALIGVTVFIQEVNKGAVTDVEGKFIIQNICAGQYHVVFSHIGCESKQIYFQLQKDTLIRQNMEHSSHVINHIVVNANAQTASSQNAEALNEQHITDHANETISNMLESIVGVNTIRNGNGIAKPVVHGLYGNRLTILNNGITQSGQQWGVDHSPEIDPLVANKLRVVKGTSALEYMGSNLGSVILVEPRKIGLEPHVHGRAGYFFESNGRSQGGNIQMQQYTPLVGWKINATAKRGGDRNSADYFLNNTGNKELNFAFQLEKKIRDNWNVDLYASTFNTELGVLRGSHIGNLTDLEIALSRDIPYYTEDTFSYAIDAPKQQVNHHLLKLQSTYFLTKTSWLKGTIAGQYNNRKEFDIRRQANADKPALSLQQSALFAELKYEKEFVNQLQFKSGIQHNYIRNINNPETSVLPLIPDYFSFQTAAFTMLSKKFGASFVDFGIRYDHTLQNVATISRTLPLEIIRYQNNFNNISTSLGYIYSFSNHASLSLNTGYAMRNPAVNELYSGGLHQGVSGIEEGNISLDVERAWKTTMGVNVDVHDVVSVEALIYYQSIENYIFLEPQDEIRLTIRGAFPVFRYKQTNAEIFGLDFSTRVYMIDHFYADLKYSYIRGNDRSESIPLINIPANNVNGNLVYQLAKPIKLGKKQLENTEIEITNRYVFRQNNLLAEQDFVLPPDAYYLLGLKLVSEIQISKTRLRFFIKADNMLNARYRDYLNRQRYFADDLGRNISLGLTLKF